MSNAVISAPGEQSARTYGRYQVVLSLPVDGGYAINVFTTTGGHRYNELSLTTRDVDTANLAHRIIKTGGEQGVSPDGIRQALTDALTRELHEVQSRRDTPSRNRVEHINRLLDDLESAATRAAVNQLADDVTAFLAGRTLTDTVPTGRRPQVARSRSNVERLPLTPAQRRIVAGHQHGIVRAGDGISWLSLRSIVRKGHADVLTRAGQKITAIRLRDSAVA